MRRLSEEPVIQERLTRESVRGRARGSVPNSIGEAGPFQSCAAAARRQLLFSPPVGLA